MNLILKLKKSNEQKNNSKITGNDRVRRIDNYIKKNKFVSTHEIEILKSLRDVLTDRDFRLISVK